MQVILEEPRGFFVSFLKLLFQKDVPLVQDYRKKLIILSYLSKKNYRRVIL